jgi:glycosyltransferase involved in cell wall biosynthesis
MQVLLTTEGTYPHYPGGVSVWCDQLVRNLSEVSFHVLAITHSPSQPQRFPYPANVLSGFPLPLWGTEEPGWCAGDFAQRYRRKLAVTGAVLKERFAPAFQLAVTELLAGSEANARLLGATLHQLHALFEEVDYAAVMESETAWRVFLAAVERHSSGGAQPSLEEVTTWMRWLTRYLAVLSVPLPRVDLVHSSFAGLAGVPGVLAKLGTGARYLLSEHGIFLRELYLTLGRSREGERNRRFLLHLNRALVKMSYHYADLITSLGEFNRKWQIRFGAPAGRIEYLANGVDPERFAPAPQRLPQRLTVVTMARISSIKGIDTLVRAAALVREKAGDVHFRVCGDVADAEYFRTIQALIDEHRLRENFTFGVATDVVAAYQEAHVFCLPSNTEGMPYSILEAMLCGCPVVATDVGNVAETLGNTGIVVSPNNPAQLAEALLWLLDAREGASRRQRLALKALKRAHTHYTVDRMANRIRQIYSRLTAAPHRQAEPCTRNPQFA